MVQKNQMFSEVLQLHEELAIAAKILTFSAQDEINVDSVNKRFRHCARLHHPDKGGDLSNFCNLTRAHEILLKHFNSVPSSDGVFQLNISMNDIYFCNDQCYFSCRCGHVLKYDRIVHALGITVFKCDCCSCLCKTLM